MFRRGSVWIIKWIKVNFISRHRVSAVVGLICKTSIKKTMTLTINLINLLSIKFGKVDKICQFGLIHQKYCACTVSKKTPTTRLHQFISSLLAYRYCDTILKNIIWSHTKQRNVQNHDGQLPSVGRNDQSEWSELNWHVNHHMVCTQ